MSQPTTLGALRDTSYRSRSVKTEIRENLLDRLRSGETAFPGIVGFDDTVLPQLESALLAGHDLVLLGERGQGKTRLMRTISKLLDEWTPVVEGCEINDDPMAPVCSRCRRLAAELGDDLPVAWKHRDERYVEKLATPDTSVGDLVGDVDPVKVAEGRTLGDPETVHYGLLPRTNRGVFGINELPDLAERIQVAMFNVLEERDIQVRGYSLRLPIDVLLVASANPEDYTNRGRIITPLKDRFGAELRTHYPHEVEEEVALIAQEAKLVADVPEHLLEVVARLTRGLRESPAVDHRSGVSARFAIAAAEGVAASALRRGARSGEGLAGRARVRRADRGAHAARQDRVRDGRGGPRGRGRPAPAAGGRRRDVPGPAGRARPVRLHRAVRRGRDGRDRRARAGRRPPRAGRHRARACPRCSTGSGTATTRRPARWPRRSSSCWRACT